MQSVNFKNWTLTTLDKSFGLKQVWQSELLLKWQNIKTEISEFEKEYILLLQSSLVRGGKACGMK